MNEFAWTPRTDLALEAREILNKTVSEDIPGVIVETVEDGEIITTTVSITTPEAQHIMGKGQGKYITIEA